MAIVDNRTLINAADAATNWTDISGSAAGSVDTDTVIEGSGSITFQLFSSIEGLMYNMGSTQDWSGAHFYGWCNVGISGSLDTQALGGLRVRFAGATITDFFEVYVAGSDTYTGGWKMFVVDVNAASASPDNSGGTPPSPASIQRVGFVGDTGGAMPKMSDNFWVDAMWVLPSGEPGIRVEGDAGAGFPWTWDNILSTAGDSWGTIREQNGIIFINTPIRFGNTSAVDHTFLDFNKIIAWEDQNPQVNASFYYLLVENGTASGLHDFRLGLKSGSGDDALGISGCTITASPDGRRWNFIANSGNINLAGLYNCNFLHANTISAQHQNTSFISCQFIDCEQFNQGSPSGNSEFLKNTVLSANTGDNEAFVVTDNIERIVRSSFIGDDGHGIELNGANTSVTFKGNLFTSYGADASSDAAFWNNSGGNTTISITDGGQTPTFRGSNTKFLNNKQVSFTGLVASPVTEVRVYSPSGSTTEIGGEESISDGDFAFSAAAGANVDIRIVNTDYVQVDFLNFIIPNNDTVIPVIQQFDRSKID